MEYHQELLDEIVTLKEQVKRWRQDANHWEARYDDLLGELQLVLARRYCFAESTVSPTTPSDTDDTAYVDYYGEFEEEYNDSHEEGPSICSCIVHEVRLV